MSPPVKRRRTDDNYTVNDLDIEISLRQRFIQNLESKIAWATLVQTSKGDATNTTPSFKDVASEAYFESVQSTRHILAAPSVPPLVLPRARPTRENRVTIAPERKFIYIKSSSLTFDFPSSTESGNNLIFLLACPTCNRSNFTNLQGLYNHGRLTHNISWGTHEECVKACITPADSSVNLQEGSEVIPSVGGFRPDIQGLFKWAVELGTPSHPNSNDNDKAGTTSTLGLHADSPALAPFLGRKVQPRQIRVFDMGHVDIVHPPDAPKIFRIGRQNRGKRWFGHSVAVEPVNPPSMNGVTSQPADVSDLTAGHTRFCLISRIVIADRSLWVKEANTYKWMLSVDSPSYSHHITTILKGLSVTFPHSSTPSSALSCDHPPFVVVSKAGQPFLARIELWFNGVSGLNRPQRQVFEHWVDLDPSRAGTVTLGEEQIVDVELDRNTMMAAAQPHHTPISSRTLWDHETVLVATKPLQFPGYEKILHELVGQFPLTKKDLENRTQCRHTPYRLMQDPSQLRSVVTGRRKAIEVRFYCITSLTTLTMTKWGRARAIREACSERFLNAQTDTMSPLSTGDVFAWLESNGHFIRQTTQDRPIPIDQDSRWCGCCGILETLHPPLASQSGQCVLPRELKPTAASMRWSPSLNSTESLRWKHLLDPRLLVEGADPSLTLVVQKMHKKFMDHLEEPPRPLSYRPIEMVREELSPYALISLTLRPLILVLVKEALGVARKDVENSSGLLPLDVIPGRQILTPRHITEGCALCSTLPLGQLLRSLDRRKKTPIRIKKEEIE